MAFKMMGGKDPKSKTGNGVPSSLMGGPKMKSCGGPMMHEGKAHDPVDTKKAKAKPKKDPKKNAINAQFDYVQKKFPNKIVQRDRQKFGSYRISSKEPSGASFGYTPGNQVTKLSSEPKKSKKKDSPLEQTRRKGYYTKAQLLAEKQGGTKASVTPAAKPKYIESRKGYNTKAQLKAEKQKKSASSVGKTAMAADTKKRKNLQSTAKGKSGRDADDKARKSKTGVYALKTNAPKTRKKVEAIKPIKAAGVKGVEKRKVAKLATSEPTEKNSYKITIKRVSEPKKEVKKTRSQKIRAKGEAALASGDKTKALRLKKRMQRVEEREKRRADRKAKK